MSLAIIQPRPQLLQRPNPAQHVLVMGQLICQLSRGLVEQQLFDQGAAVIEVHQQRFRIYREPERLLLLSFDLHSFDAVAARSADLDVYRSLKKHYLRILGFEVEQLLLSNLYYQRLSRCVIILRNAKYWM